MDGLREYIPGKADILKREEKDGREAARLPGKAGIPRVFYREKGQALGDAAGGRPSQARGSHHWGADGRSGLPARPVRRQLGSDHPPDYSLRARNRPYLHRGHGGSPHDGGRGHSPHDADEGQVYPGGADRPHPGRGAGVRRYAAGLHDGGADESGGLRLRRSTGGRGSLRGAGRPAGLHDPRGGRALHRGDRPRLAGRVHRGHPGQHLHDPAADENAGSHL